VAGSRPEMRQCGVEGAGSVGPLQDTQTRPALRPTLSSSRWPLCAAIPSLPLAGSLNALTDLRNSPLSGSQMESRNKLHPGSVDPISGTGLANKRWRRFLGCLLLSGGQNLFSWLGWGRSGVRSGSPFPMPRIEGQPHDFFRAEQPFSTPPLCTGRMKLKFYSRFKDKG
jgi:hypothetical protein